MKYYFAAVCILTLMSTPAALGQEAQLGFTWSATSDSIKQAGIELKESGVDAYGVGFWVNKLAKALTDQETTLVSFGHQR